MKLIVTLEGVRAGVEIQREGDRCGFRFSGEALDGIEGEASVIEVEPGVYSVIWDGRGYEARVGSGFVEIRGRRYAAHAADPRDFESGEGAASQGRAEVLAPMPGKVVRVLVEEGAEVTAGQGVVVVEAMKMQNEMPSPKAGRVVTLRAKAGETVAAGDLLAAIE